MLKPMTDLEIEGIAREAVQDAVDFCESEIAEDRIKAQRYFDGEVDIGEEDGRSKVVATKVRDTIRAIKPSLMRVFLSTDKPVEYVPRGTEDVQAAEQATKYMHYQFSELNGYRVLNDAFHDALVKKSGIVKVYWDTYQEQEVYDFQDLNDMEFTLLVNEPDVEVIKHTARTTIEIDQFGMEVENPIHDLKISRTMERGKMCIESVPPEEFFIDRNSRSIDDYYCVAHRTEMRVSDLVAMGYDYEEVHDLSGLQHSDTFSEVEEYERRGYESDYSDDDVQDPSMRLVAITEAYMKIDVEGTGVAQMQKVVLGGNKYKLLDYEPCSHLPFAVFEVDPEPHTFYGRSVADLIINDQDAATAMLRGVLDNVALTNNPRIEIVDGAVNIDDLLNNEIGGVIRVKQAGAVQPQSIPFVAGQTLGALQYFDQQVEDKTGVTKASTGLSPDSLQSTTATAVNATVQAQAAQIEVMARNLAEGGMRQMFKLMLQCMVENVDEEQMMRFQGNSYVPVDPRSWNSTMDVSINVGLGTGREDQKVAVLNQALQTQIQIFQAYGPGNGMVSLTNIRNTLSDILAINGIRNADRYFAPMDPMIEQQMMQQQQQAQQGQQGQQNDPNAAYLQAEQIKAQAKMQTDQLKLQLEAQKAIAEDDRKRDEMDQDLLLSAAEIIGKYGTAVDVERIKQLQNEPRYPQAQPAQAAVGSTF
jgi:hypothetical protein